MARTTVLLTSVAALELLVTGRVFAQSRPVLPPIPAGFATESVPRMESCSRIDCDVSAEQIRAFDTARSMYMTSDAAAARYSVVFGSEGSDISVTLIPSPLGARGRAITYVFDPAGATLKRSYTNR